VAQRVVVELVDRHIHRGVAVPLSAVVVPRLALLSALVIFSVTLKLPAPVALLTSSALAGTTRVHSTTPSGLGSPEATDCGT
jgi:hypothetical protein